MGIDKTDIDSIYVGDLEELVSNRTQESLRLEYKSTMYGSNDSQKKELLKDVSALANSQGGHLVIGIEEKKGVAEKLVGIVCDDSDKLNQWIEQILRSGLQPSLVGFKIRIIEVEDSKFAVVLRVPKSLRPPHRVAFKGYNRFYARNSSGVHQPDVEELRTMFNFSMEFINRARSFRDQRVALICSGEEDDPVIDEGKLIIHVIPFSSFGGTETLDVGRIKQLQNHFRPISSRYNNPYFNLEGLRMRWGIADGNTGYTQVYRNGTIEAVNAHITQKTDSDGAVISAVVWEQNILDAVNNYVAGLVKLGISGPVTVMICLEGVEGARYVYNNNAMVFDEFEDQVLPSGVLKLPEGVMDNYSSKLDVDRAMKPALDALANAAGLEKCRFYNEENEWIAPR